MSKVLGIVSRVISAYLIKKSGYSKKTAGTGAVTLIQQFGSALNFNIHFHMLFFDGVYIDDVIGKNNQRFFSVTHHRVEDIVKLSHTMSRDFYIYIFF